jgi:hypothetical protein
MHVGIIASCLPTLKPLFASFFGQISIITKGRTTGSGGLNSTPFRSNGYLKHNDRSNHFAMKNMSEGSQSTGRDPYAEDAVLGKETYTVEAGRGIGRAGGLSRTRSQAGESDESILSHDGPTTGQRRVSVPRGMTIVRTTEVNISR